MNVADRHADEFRESAVAMDAEHLQPGADVGPADGARIAVAATDHRIDHHTGTDAGLDAVAGCIDPAKELMPDHARIAGKGIAPVQDVDVGAANAGALDADADFPEGRGREGAGLDGQAAGSFDHEALHRFSSGSISLECLSRLSAGWRICSRS